MVVMVDILVVVERRVRELGKLEASTPYMLAN